MKLLWIAIIGLALSACTEQSILIPEITGTYGLYDWQGTRPDGSSVFPYGPEARGQLMLSADGHMSMQLEKNKRPALGTDKYETLDSSQVLEAYKGFFSYYGSYSLVPDSSIVVFEITGSKQPDWVGRKLRRGYSILGDTLVLSSPSTIGMDHTLRWLPSSN